MADVRKKVIRNKYQITLFLSKQHCQTLVVSIEVKN